MLHVLYIPVWEFYKFLVLTNTGYSGNKKAGSKLPAENIYLSLLDIASLAFPLREEKDCMLLMAKANCAHQGKNGMGHLLETDG